MSERVWKRACVCAIRYKSMVQMMQMVSVHESKVQRERERWKKKNV